MYAYCRVRAGQTYRCGQQAALALKHLSRFFTEQATCLKSSQERQSELPPEPTPPLVLTSREAVISWCRDRTGQYTEGPFQNRSAAAHALGENGRPRVFLLRRCGDRGLGDGVGPGALLGRHRLVVRFEV